MKKGLKYKDNQLIKTSDAQSKRRGCQCHLQEHLGCLLYVMSRILNPMQSLMRADEEKRLSCTFWICFIWEIKARSIKNDQCDAPQNSYSLVYDSIEKEVSPVRLQLQQ